MPLIKETPEEYKEVMMKQAIIMKRSEDDEKKMIDKYGRHYETNEDFIKKYFVDPKPIKKISKC